MFGDFASLTIECLFQVMRFLVWIFRIFTTFHSIDENFKLTTFGFHVIGSLVQVGACKDDLKQLLTFDSSNENLF